uniref:Uncharacterized protein n=1 Tax=Lepeophtheirus salmonis TaxID=72036 RepID=A0A0K2U7J7_LEPSM
MGSCSTIGTIFDIIQIRKKYIVPIFLVLLNSIDSNSILIFNLNSIGLNHCLNYPTVQPFYFRT